MNGRITVSEQPPPANSRLAEWYPEADLLDSYAVLLPTGFDGSVRDVAHAVFGQSEWWVRALLSTRDAIVRWFGLRTSSDMRKSGPVTDQIEFFPIISENHDEIVVGEKDKHLSFRISLLIKRDHDGKSHVFATTAVRCHNRLGSSYLSVIKPFHRLVICSRLRRAASTSFSAAS